MLWRDDSLEVLQVKLLEMVNKDAHLPFLFFNEI